MTWKCEKGKHLPTHKAPRDLQARGKNYDQERKISSLLNLEDHYDDHDPYFLKVGTEGLPKVIFDEKRATSRV